MLLIVNGCHHFFGKASNIKKPDETDSVKIATLTAIFKPIIHANVSEDQFISYIKKFLYKPAKVSSAKMKDVAQTTEDTESTISTILELNNTAITVNNNQKDPLNNNQEKVTDINYNADEHHKLVKNSSKVIDSIFKEINNTQMNKKNPTKQTFNKSSEPKTNTWQIRNITYKVLANASKNGNETKQFDKIFSQEFENGFVESKINDSKLNNILGTTNISKINGSSNKLLKVVNTSNYYCIKNKEKTNNEGNTSKIVNKEHTFENVSSNVDSAIITTTTDRITYFEEIVLNRVKANSSADNNQKFVISQQRDNNNNKLNNNYEIWNSLSKILDRETHQVPFSMYVSDKETKQTTSIKSNLRNIKKKILQKISRPTIKSEALDPHKNKSESIVTKENDEKVQNDFQVSLSEEVALPIKTFPNSVFNSMNQTKFSNFFMTKDTNESGIFLSDSIQEEKSETVVSPQDSSMGRKNWTIVSGPFKTIGKNNSKILLRPHNKQKENKNIARYSSNEVNRTLLFLNVLKNEVMKQVIFQGESETNEETKIHSINNKNIEDEDYILYENIRLPEKTKFEDIKEKGDLPKHNVGEKVINNTGNFQDKNQKDWNNMQTTLELNNNNKSEVESGLQKPEEDIVFMQDLKDVSALNKVLATVLQRRKNERPSHNVTENKPFVKNIMNKVKVINLTC